MWHETKWYELSLLNIAEILLHWVQTGTAYMLVFPLILLVKIPAFKRWYQSGPIHTVSKVFKSWKYLW